MHEHAGRQLQVGIGQHRAHAEGARHLADPAVDGGDGAREGPAGIGRGRGLDQLIRPHPAEKDLRHAELDLDLDEIVEGGQHGLVVDPGPDVDAANPHDAGERRAHGAVGELLLGCIQPGTGAEIGGFQLVDGRLGDGVVGPELARPFERQLGLAQRGLRLGDRGLLGLVVETDQDRALRDMLARPERDLGHPARAQRHDVDRLAGQRRADRLDPLADRAELRRADLDRDGARSPAHRRRGLAVDPVLMIGHGAAADRQQQGPPDRELGA